MTITIALAVSPVYSQLCNDSISIKKDSMWVSSVKNKMSSLIPGASGYSTSLKSMDTTVGSKLKDNYQSITRNYLSFYKHDSNATKRSPWIYFQNGYVQYNTNYRSRIDTPYAENDIVQHMGMVTGNFVIAGQLPVTVSYVERQSNSSLFRDFRDVRADINGPELQRYQNEKLRTYLLRQVIALKDSAGLAAIDEINREKQKMTSLLHSPDILELLIQSKENLINFPSDIKQCSWKDSVTSYSSKFIALYDSSEERLNNAMKKLDSLKAAYFLIQKKIQLLSNLINQKINTREGINEIYKVLQREGLDRGRLKKYNSFLYSVRHISLGRTIPDFSALTIKNVNVKGINAEFGNDYWYAAVTAGVVDFRIRDFVSGKQNQQPQSVFAVKAGLGATEGTHIYFTGYKGRKQISYFNSPSSEVAGASAELQYRFSSNHLFKVEVAQSTVPVTNDTTGKRTAFNMKDESARGYSLQWNSWFPKTRSSVEGYYQKTGINFQSFNSYRVNAAAESWSLRYEQYLFKHHLRINAGVKKNDFTNPLITQNYSTNTVFKTLQATFRKSRWPSLSVGYIPSSQYTMINNEIYESRYQTFTVNLNHAYKIGTANAVTNTFYSKFYNSSNDTGFIYYKANYISIFQQIHFALHTSVFGVNVTQGSQYKLYVYQVGAGTTIARKYYLEGGAKINSLEGTLAKTGTYARMRIAMKWLGDLSAWYEDGYLPGLGKSLVRNEQFNIGFTRRIK